MTTGKLHEIVKSIIGALLEIYFLARCVQIPDKLEAMLEFRNAIRRDS